MRFSPEFIEKVRDANNIVETISQYTSLKPSGHNLMGLCPFPDHREKSPSFSVSESKQLYHCFGCKKGGNIVNFLLEYNGMSFSEAIEYLAQRASIPLPEGSYPVDQKRSENKSLLLKINLLAGAFFKSELKKLPPHHPAHVYLKNRGLTPETLEAFKVGFSHNEWNALADYLASKKVPLTMAAQLGLIRQKSKFHNEFFDINRNRIMFPILSPKGEVLGFGGRTIGDDNPKYLNSPESDVFHKGRTLYGLHESAKYIRIEDSVIVVEGYMDLLMLYQHGFKNVVATLGTALTEEHAKLLKRFTKNVYVLFDSDSAGQMAQERSLPILLREGLLPKSIAIEPEKDPDEFLKKWGAASFKERMKSSQDLFLVILSRILKDFSPLPANQVSKMEEMLPYLTSVSDANLKTLYVQEVKDRLAVETNWVLNALKKAAKPQVARDANSVQDSQNKIPELREKIKIKNALKEEIFLVNLALYREDFMKELLEWGLTEKISHSGLDLVLKIAANMYIEKPQDHATITASLCSRVEDPSILMLHLDQDWESKIDIQKLKIDCLQRLNERFLKRQALNLVQELRSGEDPQKLEQFMNVIRNRQALKQND